ncbi:hypothetical protein GCM10010873_03710 [Cypionkella aquatica]|uniref:Polysaccharide chain length determinant N-terminal domain-containing protein n=1 Tax=Cypionkella aquatica TaxID=1756042 RepID=A0AA37WYH4_9RHOB|nr:Wzz/FepE/Etk N-terminal domain-containing protein [Cypionkella aquatica]GLS85398.1 hypothetical protein GCM10010873_03710 [Cypionkella aquatica]
MGQIQSIEELVSLLLRRRWMIILITLTGLLAAVVFAKTRPDIYESAAVIQIEGAQVAETNAQGGQVQPDGGGSAQILQTIEQRLTTRDALNAVIERHNLFADQPQLANDEKLIALRSSVTFQAVDSAGGQAFGQGRSISAIIVAVRYGDPEMAAQLANDFAQGILDQSAAGQRSRADTNVAFFREEEARVYEQISKLEAEVAAYKNANADAMPTLTDARRDEIVSLSDDLRQATQDLVGLQNEQNAITQKQVQRETDKRRFDDIAAQIDVLNAQIASINTRKSAIETALAATPEVERVLAGYDRQLQQLQGQYDNVTQRMAEAETTQRLSERQQAERFTLLDRALSPEYPTGGGKKKIAIAGAVASLLAALTLAFVLDLMRPVVRTAAQMQRQLDLEPVVCIPEIRAPKGRLGSAALRLIDNPKRAAFGLRRFAMIAGGATLLLILLAAVIG